jgi:hypothetical protein
MTRCRYALDYPFAVHLAELQADAAHEASPAWPDVGYSEVLTARMVATADVSARRLLLEPRKPPGGV